MDFGGTAELLAISFYLNSYQLLALLMHNKIIKLSMCE